MCVCVCVYVWREGKKKRFARVCMYVCFQSVTGFFHGHTHWAFEYPAQPKTSSMFTNPWVTVWYVGIWNISLEIRVYMYTNQSDTF